mmetsp:Transcript_34315/g.103398  ORF Transcript_34315/g.103398 Transcript_34315/m.103398 type:complete len:856 (+) Transcript_34315:295-2862(+)
MRPIFLRLFHCSHPLLFGLNGGRAHGPGVLLEPPQHDVLGVGVRHVLVLEAHLPPVLLVLVPAALALRVVLVKRIDGPEALVHVLVHTRHEARELGVHALHHHLAGHGVLGVVLVRRPVPVVVRLVLGHRVQEAHGEHALDVAGVVQEVLVPHGDAVVPNAGGEGGEVGGIHAQRVAEDHAAVVAARPGPPHDVDVVEPVAAPVADEAQGLDDVGDALQALAALEVQRVARAPLQQVHHVLAAAPGHGEEGDVADAEAAVARDGAAPLVFARVHGVVLPGVPEAALVKHRNEDVQQHFGGDGLDGLVHEPATHAGGREVLLAADEEDLLGTVLHAGADVLHSEGAVAQDRHAAAQHPLVVRVLVPHAVAYLAVEGVLSRVVYPPVEAHGARVVVHDGALRRVALLAFQGLHGELVEALVLVLAAHDLHGRDVRLEAAVRQHPVLLHGVLEVLQHLLLARVEVPVRGPAAAELRLRVLRAEPHVEGAELRLDLGVLVRRRDPAVATDLVVSVKEHDVAVAGSQVLHGGLDAIVTTADDGDRVRPHVPRSLEGLEALDRDLGPYDLSVLLLLLLRAAGHREDEVAGWRSHDLGQHGLDLRDLGAGAHGEPQRLLRALDPQHRLREVPGRLGVLVDQGVLRGPEDQDVALEAVVAHVPRLGAQLQVGGQGLESLGALGAREGLRVHLGAVDPHELLGVCRQLLLAVFRQQRLMRRGAVYHHHRRGLQGIVPLQLVGHQRHDRGPQGLAHEGEGGPLQRLALRVPLQHGLHGLVGVVPEVVQARAGLLVRPAAVARPLVRHELHPGRGRGGELRPVGPALAGAVEEEDADADLPVDLLLLPPEVLPQRLRQLVDARQPG